MWPLAAVRLCPLLYFNHLHVSAMFAEWLTASAGTLVMCRNLLSGGDSHCVRGEHGGPRGYSSDTD